MDNRCQRALFKAMACPDFYPHPVRSVTQKDTHISRVFLTGEYAYKIKKSVDLGFLDFSSLAKRHRCCKLEVALNRRLTDRVYLNVSPITVADNRFSLSGSGREVEFAVCMRQLPDDRSLASLLEQDRITVERIEALAAKLTEFYLRQASVAAENAASWKNVGKACRENFSQTRWAVGSTLDPARYRAVRSATDSFLTRNKALFNSRGESGKIYHGHGDLRSGHIYYTGKNRIQIIDCIEFNARLRTIDIASDLAFLAMDLDFRGFPDLGSTLLDVYVRKTGDWQVYALISFYKSYRAMVRCKVNCIRIKADDRGAADPSCLHRRANRYLSYAHRYAEHFARPTIWVLCGLPGAGKSAIAGLLAKQLMLTAFRSDVIRRQLFGQIWGQQTTVCLGQAFYGPAAHRLTYGKLLQQARNSLRQKQSVILDATFSRPEFRRRVLQLADEFRSRPVFVECTAPDEVLRKRLRQREGVASVSDAREHHFEMLKQGYVPIDELDPILRLQVDTTRPIDDCIHAILSWDYAFALTPLGRKKIRSP